MRKFIFTLTLLRYVLSSIIFLSFIFLNGCSHVSRKDGPPNFYVDETKIPNAVPKLEPISRYGNMNHYTVFGRRYFVLRSSRNYQERGIASWYGTKFHARHTSNGERYNMLAMTAAHKTLPLPTYVEVTNLKNNKKVIVKINDRGPFESNRLIDLSYVAAKKLGMIGHGTTYVDVKAIDPRDAITQPQLLAKNKISNQNWPQGYTPSRYVHSHSIQTFASITKIRRTMPDPHKTNLYLAVATCSKRIHAVKLKNHLMTVLSTPVRISPDYKAYRVSIGPFKNLVASDRVSQRLRSMTISNGCVNDRLG